MLKRNLIASTYKPKFLDQCVQTDIVKMLQNLIDTNMVTNFMLIGGCSTGKTTLINAFIRSYFKDYPINNNIMRLSVIQEQGIQYFRNDVKLFCQSLCTYPKKKKILVLDDLDMINEQNQQILRGYIDKCSNNIIFIASCTNLPRIIENIQSRLITLQLSPFSSEQLDEFICAICSAEQIIWTDEVKQFFIHVSKANPTVLLHYIEKCKLYMHSDYLTRVLSLNEVQQLCTNISDETFETYIKQLRGGCLADAINTLFEIAETGYSVMDIINAFFTFVKQTTQLTEDLKYALVPYICKYITVFYTMSEDTIELAFFTNNIIPFFR